MPSRGENPSDEPATGRHRGATDRNRALKDDDAARRDDPNGHGVADIADQDEPRGAPSSDRHDTETTVSRIKGKSNKQVD